MRVPLPIVIVLCAVTIGSTWWAATRHLDFLIPPSEQHIAALRAKVRASLPQPGAGATTPSPTAMDWKPVPPPEVVEPKPALEPGDFSRPPSLHEYRDLAPKGPSYLIDLAVLLETEGEAQRALLAWERVLDSSQPDATQSAAALQAIRKIRPTLPDWNSNPERRIAIILEAGAARKTAQALKTVLDEAAKELERASSGILQVSPKITPSKEPRKPVKPVPVAIWISGAAAGALSSEVLTFPLSDPANAPAQLRQTLVRLLANQLKHSRSTPQGATTPLEAAADAPYSFITRLQWRELGSLLNQTGNTPD